jgi:hypothetical protein
VWPAQPPTLPAAALVPWNVARTSVGNTSAATSHVVQLGPNCQCVAQRRDSGSTRKQTALCIDAYDHPYNLMHIQHNIRHQSLHTAGREHMQNRRAHPSPELPDETFSELQTVGSGCASSAGCYISVMPHHYQ